jgi:hypothetical protein
VCSSFHGEVVSPDTAVTAGDVLQQTIALPYDAAKLPFSGSMKKI